MVPSDPISNSVLPPASAARTTRLLPPSGVLKAPPAPPFADAKINAPKPGRSVKQPKSRLQTGLSLTRREGLLHPPQWGHRSWPSPSANHKTFPCARSALAPPAGAERLPSSVSGSSRPAPLRWLPSRGFPRRTSLCSPPRILRSFAAQSFRKLNAVKTCPRLGPISLRSPPANLAI